MNTMKKTVTNSPSKSVNPATVASQFSPNDILLTNTSLLEASRLVSGVPSKPHPLVPWTNVDVHRLVEFCNVTESVVLNDHINVLDATPLGNDEGAQFARTLIDIGIVKNTGTKGLTESATKAAYEMLGDIGNNIVYGMAINNGYENIPAHRWQTGSIEEWRQSPFECELAADLMFDENFRVSNSYRDRGQGSEKATWIEEIHHHLNRMASPSTDYTVQQIRGVFYWSLAEEARLPFSPDLLRSNWLSKWLHELKSSLSQEIYSEVATAFVADAKDLLRDTRPAKLLLPPIPAILLDRASSRETLITELLGLRDEFQPYRNSFLAIEQEKRGAQSLEDLRKVRRQIDALHASIAKKYKEPQQTTVERAIGLAGDAAKLAISPTKPDSYVTFGTKSLGWIREWWVSRPIFRLTSVTDRLRTIQNYPQLATRLLGREITASEVERFSNTYRKPFDPDAFPSLWKLKRNARMRAERERKGG